MKQLGGIAMWLLFLFISFVTGEVLLSRTGTPYTERNYTSGFYIGFRIGAAFDYMSKAADDLVIPIGEDWSIEGIYCEGFFHSDSASNVELWRIEVYTNRNNEPFSIAISKDIPHIAPYQDGRPTLEIDPPLVLTGGVTHWIGIFPIYYNSAPNETYWVWQNLNGPVQGNPGKIMEFPLFSLQPPIEPGEWYDTTYDYIWTVNGTKIDTQPPSCVNLNVNPSIVNFYIQSTQQINITLWVSDNFEADYGILTINGPEGSGIEYNLIFNQDNRISSLLGTSIYSNTEITLEEGTHPLGQYNLVSLQLYDTTGNVLNLTSSSNITTQCGLMNAFISVTNTTVSPSPTTSNGGVSDTDSEDDDSDSNVLVIVLCVIAATALVVLIAAVVYWKKKNSRSKENQELQ